MEVVSQFVDHGPVVYEQTSDGKKKEYDAISGGLATKIPMVVLINSNSASASEITAGALQDDGRAKLVGVVSYGKGSVQIRVPLSNNEGAVAITIAHWLTPKGTLIDKKGLTPDVYVPMTAADYQCRARSAAGCGFSNPARYDQRNSDPDIHANGHANSNSIN